MKRWREAVVMGVIQVLALGVLLLVLPYTHPADARPWKPKPQQLITEYGRIMVHRAEREMVMIQWTVAEGQMVTNPTAQKLLHDYMVISIAHMRLSHLGEMQGQIPTGVRVQTADGKEREPIDPANLPPAAVGFFSAVQSGLARGLGRVGQDVKLFAFDGMGIAACEEGKVWVLYAGERYFYETPFPGCDQLSPVSAKDQ